MARYFAIVPAAGTGSRLGGSGPKQYQPLLGRPMIYHALRALGDCSRIERIHVVLAAEDRLWQGYDWSPFSPKLKALHCGGATRAQSVRNALEAAAEEFGVDDWALVHDAARPCLTRALLTRLLDAASKDEVGGLLAVPVADTLKRAQGSRVAATFPRDSLWRAQTPQMFRLGLLREALDRARDEPTDESAAVEALGLQPRLILGDPRNVKVTYPEDLALAEAILQALEER